MSNIKPKIILLSGYARSGKDTFYDIFDKICNKNYIATIGYSFAAELKNDLAPLVARMGININNPTDEQKKIIRNLMIAYGCVWREIDINHWVKVVDGYINEGDPKHIHVIRDNRFISETEYFINKYGRENITIVEITRIGAPPPPDEELKNQPKISAVADYHLTWDTDPSLLSLKPKVVEFCKYYFNKK